MTTEVAMGIDVGSRVWVTLDVDGQMVAQPGMVEAVFRNGRAMVWVVPGERHQSGRRG